MNYQSSKTRRLIDFSLLLPRIYVFSSRSILVLIIVLIVCEIVNAYLPPTLHEKTMR